MRCVGCGYGSDTCDLSRTLRCPQCGRENPAKHGAVVAKAVTVAVPVIPVFKKESSKFAEVRKASRSFKKNSR